MPALTSAMPVDFLNSTFCLDVEIINKWSWFTHVDKLCKGYGKKPGALETMPRLSPQVLEEIYSNYKKYLRG